MIIAKIPRVITSTMQLAPIEAHTSFDNSDTQKITAVIKYQNGLVCDGERNAPLDFR